MMARSSLASAIFFGTKPYPSQIIHGLLRRRPFPPVCNVPCWSPVGLLYSTKPSTEPLKPPQRKAASSTSNVQSSLSAPFSTLHPLSSSLLNPPPSTRPPPFDIPATPPKISIAYLFALGKASLNFYKTGLKAIYTNYKLMRSIRARLSTDANRMPRTELLKKDLISRAEYHLLQRTVADLSRLPLFAVIFLVFSEWTPLVVIALSSAVPRTLWIPKQVQKARERQQERRNAAKATWQGIAPADVNRTAELPHPLPERDTVLSIGRMLGAYPAWWDRFLPWTPVGAVRSRVQRRLEALEADDMAIERDGAVHELEELEEEEVIMAAEARGLDVVDKDVEELRQDLENWLQARKHHSPIELIVNGVPASSKTS